MPSEKFKLKFEVTHPSFCHYLDSWLEEDMDVVVLEGLYDETIDTYAKGNSVGIGTNKEEFVQWALDVLRSREGQVE
jgi:hypothetical protein